MISCYNYAFYDGGWDGALRDMKAMGGDIADKAGREMSYYSNPRTWVY